MGEGLRVVREPGIGPLLAAAHGALRRSRKYRRQAAAPTPGLMFDVYYVAGDGTQTPLATGLEACHSGGRGKQTGRYRIFTG
jgi:hypothetical protein